MTELKKDRTEYMRQWRAKNREKYNEYHRKLRSANPERYSEYQRKSRAKKEQHGDKG